MKRLDVAIIGGGPGGSTLGAYLANMGFDVAIFEREEFPRFHIGESLLPSTMPIFKETGFYETLDKSDRYIRKYGARFVDYRLDDDEIYFGFDNGFNPDIPMAFEVERSLFDRDILDHAAKCGAAVFQPARVKEIEFYETHAKLSTTEGEFEASFVADATGRDSILGKKYDLRIKNQDLNNVAVFTHFKGVERSEGRHEGDIIIGLLPHQSWSWVIPFKGEITSVGVVCNAKNYKGKDDLLEYINDCLNTSTRLKRIMKNAVPTMDATVISNYSHHCTKYAGDRWILIGDSAIFLDPIFSSGVHVSCTSARLASKALEKALKSNATLTKEGLDTRYKENLDRGVKRFHSLISLFYRSNFVEGMKKTLERERVHKGFVSAVAGDMWNDDNYIFKMDVL